MYSLWIARDGTRASYSLGKQASILATTLHLWTPYPSVCFHFSQTGFCGVPWLTRYSPCCLDWQCSCLSFPTKGTTDKCYHKATLLTTVHDAGAAFAILQWRKGPRGLSEWISLRVTLLSYWLTSPGATSGLSVMRRVMPLPYCLNHFHSSSKSLIHRTSLHLHIGLAFSSKQAESCQHSRKVSSPTQRISRGVTSQLIY